jgi:hypothetical protein
MTGAASALARMPGVAEGRSLVMAPNRSVPPLAASAAAGERGAERGRAKELGARASTP